MRSPARAAIRTTRPRHRRPGVESQLEGAATEFALLAQRRARLSRQIDLLRRQHEAAEATLGKVVARMAELTLRIGQMTPADGIDAPPAPPAAARRRGALLTY
jgi:chromosome segregation ATPase